MGKDGDVLGIGKKARVSCNTAHHAGVFILHFSLLKDLALGAELAKSVESRAAWVKNRPAQITVKRKDLVAELRKLLGR